ncbi:MAG: histidine phosphatase family protein [Acidimicrobiales bacterium]|nr:histidine phosphatase family protein [Acidimicrobiales bacterium]
MELVLVRHARPERIDHDPNGANPALTDLGHRQAAAMARYLADHPIEHVYVSPQLRAQQTASPLIDTLSVPHTTVDGVAEYDLGHSMYIPGEEYGPMTAEDLDELIEGLTGDAFQSRVLESMDLIINENPGRTVAVVCHGGVISTLVADILGTDPRNYFDTSYTSVTRVRASRSGRRSLASFNECHWLRDLD